VKAIPLAGRQVLNPETKHFLPEAGEEVSPDNQSYWLRREADGDVRLTTDAFVVALRTEWDRMAEEAGQLNAQADVLVRESEALQAEAKAKTEEAARLRAAASQKDRAVKAALGGKDK
jgi:hypothetical protein